MARKMKDSGADWLGMIPADWDNKRINALYHLRNEKVSDRDYAPLSVSMKGVVPQLESTAKTDDHDNRKLVREGDFAINSRSDRRNACGISDRDGSVSLINLVLSPREKMYPSFYNWLFHSSQFADEFFRWGHGIVDDLWTTGWQDMKNIILPYPSLPEQHRIADYLDKKCASIDSSIETGNKEIEKLKEYKLLVITKAVTKGLNPNVEIIDSGIKDIGKIAKNFDVIRLRFLVKSMRNGYVGPTKDILCDEGIKYIQSLHIKDGKIDFLREPYYVSNAWASIHPKIHTNNLLIIQTGDIGNVALVDNEYDGCNCHALIITVIREDKIYPNYLKYYFMSSVGLHALVKYETGTTLKHLNSTDICDSLVCFPNHLDEQIAIANYLDKKCSEIDTLIHLRQQMVNKLTEYKKSLIYAYVTGKKEVPHG